MAKTTVVTMYFNIKNLPDATEEVRPKSFYMDKGRVTLSLKNPMVIFCDDTCYEDIKAIRGDLPTHYIIRPFENYDFYKDNYPIIRANREGNPMYVGNRNTSSYCLLCLFKIYAIHLAHQVNPFHTTHYAWIDFGGSHVLRNLADAAPVMLDNPHPKVGMCYIHYRNGHEMTLTSQFAHGGLCSIGGTAFTVEGSYVTRFYNGCMSIFHELLLHRLCHADEQVMAYFYHRYPELCTLYYGDYYSIITNYNAIKEDYPSIRHFFIQEALNKGRADLAGAAAKSVLQSVEKGLLALDAGECAWLRRFV
jgi:Bacterial protein of unknown function (HtrL_YibB)